MMEEEGKIPIRFIGISAPPMKDQLVELKKRVFQGMTKVELGFWGNGKGSLGGGNTTPEMYGKDMRQDIRELGKVNDMDLSTHVSPSVYGWGGYRQNEFNDFHLAENMREVRRTIEFAADTTNGGAVVIHTGEFPRSLATFFGHEGFEMYPGEIEKARHELVNEKTGQVITQIANNQKVWIPKYETDEDGEIKYFKNPDGSILRDELGKPVPKLALSDNNQVQLDSYTFKEYMEREQKMARDRGESIPTQPEIVKKFYREQMNVQVDQALGQSRYFGEQYHIGIDSREKILGEISRYQRLRDTMGEEQFESYVKDVLKARSSEQLFTQLNNGLHQAERQIQQGKESLTSGKRTAAQIMDQVENAVDIVEYGVKRSANSIGQLGMEAFEKTREKQKSEPTFKPLFIAPENIYPEQYGAHPQELKELILRSRESMVQRLMQKEGMSEEEAKEVAKTHIKATFDIGHVNTWWKYYNGSREDFKKWALGQVQDLVNNDIIGHAHIADNWGYEDEHTTPGQGTAPIKEFVKILAKADITDMITEPAHQDIQAQFGSWNLFGGNVNFTALEFANASSNGLLNQQADRWTNIQNSYFGKVHTPNFIAGDYSPSQEFRGAPFYTGLPLE